jgi:putative two-component system response regulator
MDIVIIDDDRFSLLLLESHVVALGGYRPVTFTRPAEGLDWCTAYDPDLVIVDYRMPEMNGVEFAQRFRSLSGKSEIPVVMVTGYDERELRHRALAMGINDFLTKPVDPIELTARLRNMLALRLSQKNLAQRAQLLAEEAAKNARAARDVAERERETLLCLSLAAERRDPETNEHIIRMSNYSRLIGLHMGLTEEQAELLLLASPLHDVGKLGIPDRILLKPGPLTAEEFDLMKQHTVIGAQILGHSKSPILQAGAQIALSHHEKFDGSGYPQGLRGDDIPLFGRIVAVADAFDALVSVRPYKKAWEVEAAVAYIRDHAGGHFDPECVKAFLGALGEILEIKALHQDTQPEGPQIAAAA